MRKESARESEGNSAARRMVSTLCEMRTPCQELVMERDAYRAAYEVSKTFAGTNGFFVTTGPK